MKTYTIVAGVDGVGKSSFIGVLKETQKNLGTIFRDENRAEEQFEVLLLEDHAKKGVSCVEETNLFDIRPR